MPKRIKPQRLESLYKAILSLETLEECEEFFEDLCSATELSAMEQRFQVAELLMQDKVYTDILARTNTSTSTISRIKRTLVDGNGRLAEAIERVQTEEKQV